MTPMLAQAYAARAAIDALILQIELSEGVPSQGTQPGSCPNCGASSEFVKDASTLDGTKRNRCENCGAKWDR